MPADIRSFFAPKNGGTPAPKPKPTTAATPTPAKKQTARKRRIVESDDDEAETSPPPKKASASKKTPVKAKEPEKKETKVEVSSYFSSTGKNKVNRTAPIREARPKKVVVKQPKKGEDYLDDDDELPDDIFAEAFQKKDDDYQEEHDEDEDMDDFVVPDDEGGDEMKNKKQGAKTSASGSKKTPASASKKRKPVPSDDEEDVEEAPKKKTPSKKPPVKKARAPAKKKEEPEESSEIQKILDAIPTVRPPTPPPREEGKKFNYREFAARSAATTTTSGSKVIPAGADNCLAGLTFVFTGVLETLSREEGQQLVKKYGGKVTGAPSKKTSYVVLGSDAGPKKLETIRAQGIKTINEDGLFALIKSLPPNGGDSKAAKEYEAKQALEEKKIKAAAAEMQKSAEAEAKAAAAKGQVSQDEGQLWTTKYAPTKMSDICGNKGQVEKLQKWLQNWPKNLKLGFKVRGADGSGVHRAVIIHGPPGIGKTTAVHLVAKLEGYDVLEYNASDTRSKKLMEETMRGVLDNTSLKGYFAPGTEKVDASKKKLVLIMDEVDGMSAGDRGGVGQLASLCRKTSIPIICICNERKLPKMKPFDNVTLDMAFRRPDAGMIRSRIASIAFREKMPLKPAVIDQLVEGTRADIRQIINMMSTYKTTSSTMSFDESKDFTKAWEKHVIFKPWDIAQKLLGTEMFGATSKKTLNDKMELYFNDHEFSYLMIQENYLKNRPERASNYRGKEANLKMLELADNAAMSISDGDLADAMIHGPQQHWSLMPVHGMLSTVIPASNTYGSYGGGQMSFTSWLGNNSKMGKLSRFVKEIQSHIRLRASGDRHEIRQSYIPSFFNQLVRRLQVEGKDAVPEIIQIMDDYFLTKEDWDAIVELGVGPCDENTVQIPSQTKSAFTREYNKMSHPMPFMKASSVAATKASKKEVPDIEDAIIESEDESPPDVEKDDEDDISKDKYVKQPKKKAALKKAAAPKGKGKAKVKEDSDEDDEESDEKPKKMTKAARGKVAAGRGGAKAARGGRAKKA